MTGSHVRDLQSLVPQLALSKICTKISYSGNVTVLVSTVDDKANEKQNII
jgi:hypothetical protein